MDEIIGKQISLLLKTGVNETSIDESISKIKKFPEQFDSIILNLILAETFQQLSHQLQISQQKCYIALANECVDFFAKRHQFFNTVLLFFEKLSFFPGSIIFIAYEYIYKS